MNLIDLFDNLTIPNGNEKILNAIQVPDYLNFRIAVNRDGDPIILLLVTENVKNITLKNFKLKYLQLEQNIECKIIENFKTSQKTFTVITFKCTERNLQEYFLRIAETLIKTIGNNPTQQHLVEALNKFVEVFRALTDPPTNTIHGLWTELFIINNCKKPETLLNYWHSTPEEKFDFDSGVEKIEVKSNGNFERVHFFSSEQLNPPIGSNVLIASIFIRQSSVGQNIQQLVDSISIKISHDNNLTDKLNSIVCRSLGNSLEQSILIKFDCNIAEESLQYYNFREISRIEKIHIPNEVSELRYKSDLSLIRAIDKSDISNGGELFNSL